MSSIWGLKSDPTSRMSRLFQRQEIISTIRDDLYSQGFLEVETPLLVKATCPDAHIESIEAKGGYLVTSTEYQIKRMIAGGFQKLFTLGKNFRAGDQGRYHAQEFTMLEWARAEEPLKKIEEDAERFIKKAFKKLHSGKTILSFNGQDIDIAAPWQHLTVREAFQRYLGLDHLEDFSLKPLLSASKVAKIPLPTNFINDKGLVISYLLDLLQPHLGKTSPTFLHAWPAYLTASAPIKSDDPYIAERTELYIGGIEIANGFPFLRDADLQRRLFEEELKARKAQGKPPIAFDELYLKALKHLPLGAGMALGIDRLALVLTQSDKLSDLLAFSWDEL